MSEKQNFILRTWRVLASMRLGLVLMFLLAGASTFGVVVPRQSESKVLSQVIAFLGLNNVFATWWFTVIAYLLGLNVMACVISRARIVVNVFNSPRMTINAIDRLKNFESFFLKERPEDVSDKAIQILLANRFRVLQNSEEDQTLIYADKHKLALLGSLIVHLGLLIFMAGITWVNVSGFEGSISAPAGSTFKLSQLTSVKGILDRDLSIKVDRNTPHTISKSGIQDVKGVLSILENGTVQESGEVGFNSPLRYQGLNFHLVGFEDGVAVSVNTPNQGGQYLLKPETKGKWPFLISEQEELYLVFSNIAANINRPGVDYAIIRNGNAPVTVAQGHLNQGEAASYGKVSFALDGYLGTLSFQVEKKPGIGLLLAGLIILLIGMSIALFLRYRKIWINIITEGEQTQVLVGGYSGKQKNRFSMEFSSLVEQLRV